VTISILREGQLEPFDVTLVREVIEVKSVRQKDLGDGIYYVRIASFQERTAKTWSAHWSRRRRTGPTP